MVGFMPDEQRQGGAKVRSDNPRTGLSSFRAYWSRVVVGYTAHLAPELSISGSKDSQENENDQQARHIPPRGFQEETGTRGRGQPESSASGEAGSGAFR
jgi:hypothetical protein